MLSALTRLQKYGLRLLQVAYTLAFIQALLFLGTFLWQVRQGETISKLGDLSPANAVNLVISFLVVIVGVLWKVPQWQATAAQLPPAEQISLEDNLRKTLAQILAGAFVLTTLFSTLGTISTNQEGQITERFTRAIDQLGRQELEIRLGGIYSLERIANDSKKDYWSVIEVLTAFVRQHSPAPQEKTIEIAGTAIDVQAALMVLGRRPTYEKASQRLNLPGIHLQQADLPAVDWSGANLSQVFWQSINLSGANLSGANLSGANLYGVDLSGANLSRANLYEADLNSVNLRGANLHKTKFLRTKLNAVDLSGGDLREANLLNAQLKAVDLRGGDLSGVTGLSVEQIQQMKTDNNTKFPN